MSDGKIDRIPNCKSALPEGVEPYPIAADTFGREEIAAVAEVMQSEKLTMGERVRRFEQEFAAWVGARHAVMVNSGSSANLLAVDCLLRRGDQGMSWRAGDEVIVPALSWPTTVWPLVQLGLVPVFVDVDPETLAIDLDSAAGAVSPRTRGMMLIHVLGQIPDMGRYTAFCREHGLLLVEDSCESLGAHHHGRHAGTFGVLGTFSCYFSHHISTIEGGVIVTQDQELRDDLVSMRAHGWIRDRSDYQEWKEAHPELDPRFLFITSGYNLRPTEIQGALGSVQLGRLDGFLSAREMLVRRVHGWLAESAPWIRLVGASRLPGAGRKVARSERSHSWMQMPMILEQDAPTTAAKVKQHFECHGVETRALIAGNLVRHPAMNRFATRTAESLERCDAVLERGFMIGCHPVVSPGAEKTLRIAIERLNTL